MGHLGQHGIMPTIAMLVAVLIWGASFIATKAAVADIPPIAFAMLRFALAVAGLGVVHLLTRTPLRVERGLWRPVVVAALTGVTLTYVLENTALQFTTAGNSALFIAASPLVTMACAVLFLKERLTWRMGVGSFIAFGAMVALVGANFQQTGVGDLLMAVNTLVGAVYVMASKKLADRMSPLTALTVSFFIGTVALVPCTGIEAWITRAPWHMTPTAIGALLFLGLGSSCLAYWLWMYALSRMTAATSGLYLYLMPVVTLLLSARFLGETLTPLKLVEAGLILLGVYVAVSQPEPQRRLEKTAKAPAAV